MNDPVDREVMYLDMSMINNRRFIWRSKVPEVIRER